MVAALEEVLSAVAAGDVTRDVGESSSSASSHGKGKQTDDAGPSTLSPPTAGARDSAHAMHHEASTHSAHHLKFGAIKTDGFAPDASKFDADDLKLCGDRGIRHEDLRREMLDAEARRIQGKRRYLFRKPRPLQYFRGNTLVRSDDERSSQRLELFYDLVYVGVIAVLAHGRSGPPPAQLTC